MSTILYIGAHNDDAEIWAGGTLLKHRLAGDVCKVILRDSQNDSRKAEQRKADELSGFATEYYGTVDALQVMIMKIVPDVVITHWDGDSHPDHRQVCEDVMDAVKKCRMELKKPDRFLFCDTYNKMGYKEEFEPNVYVDISDTILQKRELIQYFTSQNPAYWIDKAELISRLYGSRCRCEHAEGFRQFSLLGSAFAKKSLL